MRLGLLFLITILFSQGARANLESCERWKQCSSFKDPVMSYAIESCKQQLAAANCDDFYNEDPEYMANKRSCDPYTVCQQFNDSPMQINSCVDGVKELWEDNVDAVKGLKNLVSAQFWIDLYRNMSLEKYQLAATDLMEKKHRQYVCLNGFYRKRMACYGVLLTVEVITGGILLKKAGGLAGKFFRRSKNARKEQAAVATSLAVEAEKGRERFIESHLHKNFTDEFQNQAWIEIADTADGKTKFLDIENASMKELNDMTRNKNLVTSITNKHKEILIQKMIKLTEENPGLEIFPYTDYKSIRFAFRGKIPADLQQQLGKIFEDANREFDQKLRQSQIIRSNENNSKNWFRAGYGSTADQANAAARYSRSTEGTNRMQSFSDPRMQATTEQTLGQLREKRGLLENDPVLRGTPLMEKIQGTQKLTLSQPAFDILRKSKSADEVIRSARAKYGVQLSPEQAQRMIDYSGLVDRFSPGLRIAKREIVNLDEAEAGGFTVDFAGMGSRNLRATAEALERSDKIETLLEETRKGEISVTQEFRERVVTLKEKVSSGGNADLELTANCSADDCVGLAKKALSSGDKQKILDDFASDPRTNAVRVAFIPENVVEKSSRTRLATHGESIEKFLRKNLEGVIPQEKLDGVVFGVDMQTPYLNRGGVRLMTATRPGQALTSAEQNQIQRAFSQAVRDHNSDLKSQKIDSNYTVSRAK